MAERDLERRLIEILRANAWFMQLLAAARACEPPDWLVGAGVVRNTVWDYLHGYTAPTPLADVDLAFFDRHDLRPERDSEVQEQLRAQFDAPWEATNQAAVHTWYEQQFGYAVLSADGVDTWPETAACVGVRLLLNGELLVVAPCGLDDLLGLVHRRNPRRVSVEQYRRRLREKAIGQKWPQVRVIEE
jgi:hypothetical protein